MDINKIPQDILALYKNIVTAEAKLVKAETEYKACYNKFEEGCKKFNLEAWEIIDFLREYFKKRSIKESLDVPDDVMSAYKDYADYNEKVPQKMREPFQKSISTKKFNKFITACKNNNLDYTKILPKLSNGDTTKSYTFTSESFNDSVLRNKIVSFVGSKKDGVTIGELFEFFNAVQEENGGNQTVDADWLIKNSRLVGCFETGKQKRYRLTDIGKKAMKYLNSTNGIVFHPDYISNNRGWADGPGNAAATTTTTTSALGGSATP